MKEAYLLLDVGGTQIKAGVADEQGVIIGRITSFPACAKSGRSELFNHFSAIIRELQERSGYVSIAGVGMAFPGPFDYEKGVSQMKGLDKYDSIYGLSIEDEIKKRIAGFTHIRFHFLHDVEAFALGESQFGEGKTAEKLLCLCIGTGTGSAFISKRQALKEERDGVPQNGWLYDTPYKDSIIDDYLSVRGLAKLSKKMTGKALDGKQLYERCIRGEEEALSVYQAFGADLIACILPFVDAFCPDFVVFGGQISGSFPYFGREFEEECKKRNVKIYLEPETSVRAMQGLYVAMKQEV